MYLGGGGCSFVLVGHRIFGVQNKDNFTLEIELLSSS